MNAETDSTKREKLSIWLFFIPWGLVTFIGCAIPRGILLEGLARVTWIFGFPNRCLSIGHYDSDITLSVNYGYLILNIASYVFIALVMFKLCAVITAANRRCLSIVINSLMILLILSYSLNKFYQNIVDWLEGFPWELVF